MILSHWEYDNKVIDKLINCTMLPSKQSYYVYGAASGVCQGTHQSTRYVRRLYWGALDHPMLPI